MKLLQLLSAGVLGASLLTSAKADVTLVITGGNASRAVQYDRANFLLSGKTVVNGPNSNIRSYVGGTLVGQPGLGIVNIHFILNGASQGIIDLRDQNLITNAQNALVTAQLAVTGNAPETIGINGNIFTSHLSLVVPFVFVKNPNLANTIAGVNNLTQRQAALLEAVSGTLPTAFFGGESTTDPLYLIGRNTGAAVRQIIDANIYFSGAPSFWTTNSTPGGLPVPTLGHDGGGKVTNDLQVIPNAIGTVASADINNYTVLTYEGVPFTPANVAKGFYPIWGYERWLHKNSGAGQASADHNRAPVG